MVVDKRNSKHKVVTEDHTPSEEELLMENAGDVGFNWMEALKDLFK